MRNPLLNYRGLPLVLLTEKTSDEAIDEPQDEI